MTTRVTRPRLVHFIIAGSAGAQTPAVGDSPNAATVGQDYAIAQQRRMNWEPGLTTGYSIRSWVGRAVINDRMLSERFAPDAEQGRWPVIRIE